MRRKLMLLFVFVILPLGCITSVVIATMWLGWLHDESPVEYQKAVRKLIGDVGSPVSFNTEETMWTVETPNGSFREVSSVTQPFYIKYWNGSTVLFRTPAEPYNAALAAYQTFNWCSPMFTMALAHSESPNYTNYDTENEAGAMGVMQFLPGTWNGTWNYIFENYPDAWIGSQPERTNIPAAFLAACVYTHNNGIIDALSGTEDEFVFEFAQDPPVWNQHPPQASYVWRNFQEQYTNLDDEDLWGTDLDFELVEISTPIRKGIVFLLQELGFSDLINQDPPPNDGGSCFIFPPETDWYIYTYPNGSPWHDGCNGGCPWVLAYDYIAPAGTPEYLPFPGHFVIYDGRDGYGNSWFHYVGDPDIGWDMIVLHSASLPGFNVNRNYQAGEQFATNACITGHVCNPPHPHVTFRPTGVHGEATQDHEQFWNCLPGVVPIGADMTHEDQ